LSPKKKINGALFPADLGFRMPAEWEPMAATWMVWPHNRTDWPGHFEPIPHVYTEIVKQLARVGRVELVVNDDAHELRARSMLEFANVLPKAAKKIRFHQWKTNRGWTRDSGPIFVKNRQGEVAATNWRFNAWAKYRNWQLDDQLPELVAKRLNIQRFDPEFETSIQGSKVRRMVLEGGSIDVNGQGLLMTTEECLLSDVQARNPRRPKAELEQMLSRYLGIEKVLWLGRGIVGDDTHGHVDDIARFVNAKTVVALHEPKRSDANFEMLNENLKRLAEMTDLNGGKLDVARLPLPAPVIYNGQRVPASYANFYIFNGLVLVPVFNDKNDRVALNTLAELMPRHEIVPIYCGDLIWGLGAIHCMTQQQPV
jgi:agmatine deiminase